MGLMGLGHGHVCLTGTENVVALTRLNYFARAIDHESV